MLSLLAINYVLGLVEPGKRAARPDDDDPEAAAVPTRFTDNLTGMMTKYPHLARAARYFSRADPETMFAVGIEILLDGLEARLANSAPHPALGRRSNQTTRWGTEEWMVAALTPDRAGSVQTLRHPGWGG